MKINYFGKTDKGKVRKANEDCFASKVLNDNEYLFVVADGMGGHQAGDVASQLGTATFISKYETLRAGSGSIIDAMQRSIKEANATILARASKDPSKKGMGTTFSAMVISGMKAFIVHVGDSRIYLVRDDSIRKITTDHTFVEKMMEEGRLSEEEARNHPQKNILYMSLGARESFAPIVIDGLELKNGDIFIMCSDGLNNMVSDEIIKSYSLSYANTEALVEELVNLANDKGGTDNITIQAIQVGKIRSSSKTEPIPIPPRPKGVPVIPIFFGVLVILFILYWFFMKG